MDNLQYPMVHGDLPPILGKWDKTAPKDNMGHHGGNRESSELSTYASKLCRLLVSKGQGGGHE